MILCENIENQLKKEIKEMEDQEREAYLHGGLNAHEYAASIGKSDLATLTSEEWLTFCECMCKNYHSKFSELDIEPPF